jgi:glutathionylspermidine synthase
MESTNPAKPDARTRKIITSTEISAIEKLTDELYKMCNDVTDWKF